MFSFINTAVWPFLFAIALPILIHLLTKKKLKVVPFSTLAFLKQMQRDQIRHLKLRQLFLLILRMLIVALLVLAFARPTLRSRSAVLAKRANATLCIIVDNSLSMAAAHEGASLLQRARRQAQSLAALLEPGDEAFLVSAAAPAKTVGGPYRSPEMLAQAVNEVSQQWRNTDLAGSLALGVRLLHESKNVNKELYVFSDFCSPRMTTPIAATANQAATMRGIAVRFAAEYDQNAALLRSGPANQIFEAGKTVEFSAAAASTGAPPRDTRSQQATLFLNGKRAAQQTMDIPAGQQRSYTFRAVPPAAGFVACEVRLEDDGLLLDNSRFFAFYVPSRRRVLLCSPTAEDVDFLRLALDSGGNGQRIAVRTIAPDALARENFVETDAVALVNVPRVSDGQVQQLTAFVQQGGGLVIFPGSAVDLRQYNETLLRKFVLGVFGGSMGALAVSGSANPAGQGSFMSIGKMDFAHPMLIGVFEQKPTIQQIDSPMFRFGVQLRAGSGVEIVAEYNNGFPFVVERSFGRGRIVLFTTAADATWSDFTFKGLFAPLVERAVAFVARGLAVTDEALVGSELTAYLAANTAPEAEVETPAGERVRARFEAGSGSRGYRVRFGDTAQPGIYRLWQGGQLVHMWAVNFDAAEAGFPALADGDLEKMLPEVRFQFAAMDADLAEVARQVRFGNELWPVFLGLAVLAMGGEMLLFRVLKQDLAGEEKRRSGVRRLAESA